MTRPTNDEYYMSMVDLVASRGTCARRKVGCILVDDKKRILATGFNGVAPGVPHCIDTPCTATNSPSGTNLSACRASHAEQAALLHCHDVMRVHTAYVTTSPCQDCVKLLMLTGCKRVVFADEYPHTLSKIWWEEFGGEWVHLPRKVL